MEDLDTLFFTLYDSISGPAGSKDWHRIVDGFHPRAILTRVLTGDDGQPKERVMSLDEYVEATKPFLDSTDFWETEVEREIEHFGNVAHARSVYESRWHPDEPPFMRGTNSVQLYHDGSRWWILSMAWDNGANISNTLYRNSAG